MKSTTSLKLTFTKLTNAQQYYEQTSYTEFHPNCTVNVESMERNLFMPLITV